MNKYLLLIFLCSFQYSFAQDLLSILDEEDKGNSKVTSIFKDNRIVNAQSSKQTAQG